MVSNDLLSGSGEFPFFVVLRPKFNPATSQEKIFAITMVYLTRRERFNAAHKLWVDAWSDDKNLTMFGKCANRNWHGHNYDLFVTVKGDPDPVTGFVMDVKRLSQLIKEYIVDKVDHSNLNLDVEFIPKGMQPTTENLAVLFWQQLSPHIHECSLHCIKLYETENIYVEYFGE